MMNDRRVELVAENTGEVRVYLVQYWSSTKQRRVREYADAVPEVDLAEMSPFDRVRVRHYAHQNLHATADARCTPTACAGCKARGLSHKE
jgi:hypothetical protein